MSAGEDIEEEDADALAAEYVLGLTPPDAQPALRQRLARDAAFAAAVAGWQESFVRLTDDIKPQKPPRKLKTALKRRLFGRSAQDSGPRLWVWQVVSFAALATAAYISLNDLRIEPRANPPVFVAALDNAVEGLRVLVVYDPLRGEVALRRLEGGAAAGRALEFWAIPPGADPVSLGVLPATEQVRIVLPESLAAQAPQLTFAISDEPQGGSPTGAPTGQILGASPVNEL